MTRLNIEVSIWIACSPERVWNYLCDVSNEVLWRYGVLFAEWITDPPREIGSIGYHFIQGLGDYPWKVVELKEPEHMSWDVFAGRFKGARAGYRISPEDAGSRMTIYVNANQNMFLKIMVLVLKGFFKRQLVGDLERLKAILEVKTS